MEVDCCGDRGAYGEVLLGVWNADDGSTFLQLPRTNFYSSDENWPAVEKNLRQAQGKWV